MKPRICTVFISAPVLHVSGERGHGGGGRQPGRLLCSTELPLGSCQVVLQHRSDFDSDYEHLQHRGGGGGQGGVSHQQLTQHNTSTMVSSVKMAMMKMAIETVKRHNL